MLIASIRALSFTQKKGEISMKAKRLFVFVLCVALLTALTITAHAGNHHRHGGGRRNAVAWHNPTDYYGGHYSNQCAVFNHVWHGATRDYQGHYSYECAQHEHHVWHGATSSYKGHYSNQCVEFEHAMWHGATNAYEAHYNSDCALHNHVWYGETHEYKGHYGYNCANAGHNHQY
jgi:hypothetical protein